MASVLEQVQRLKPHMSEDLCKSFAMIARIVLGDYCAMIRQQKTMGAVKMMLEAAIKDGDAAMREHDEYMERLLKIAPPNPAMQPKKKGKRAAPKREYVQ